MKLTPAKQSATLRLKPVAQETQQRWGSPEEVYRRYCLLVLAHRYLYYVEHTPIITDYEYDLMERYLVHLEKTTGVFHDESPVRTVGSSDRYSYPESSIRWAQKIMNLQVPRNVYFIEHLLNQDWQNYLNALPLSR